MAYRGGLKNLPLGFVSKVTFYSRMRFRTLCVTFDGKADLCGWGAKMGLKITRLRNNSLTPERFNKRNGKA